MPFENIQTISTEAAPAADVVQRRFVKETATGTAHAGLGDMATGVSMGTVLTADEARAIAVASNNGCRAEVEASAAVTVGANVASAANGKAKIAASGEVILGVCVSAAAADGEYCDIIFNPQGAELA